MDVDLRHGAARGIPRALDGRSHAISPSLMSTRELNELRAFTTSVIARETLREVAEALGARGIPVMPLKGVLFQLILYADPAERRVSDVDVLVPEGRFGEAITILVQHGYRPDSVGPSWIEAAFQSPRGLPLDLHRRVFCPRRYRMPTDELFLRATRDEALLGVPLWIQHPLDTLAHLVGKFVSDHVHSGAEPRLRELEKLIEHYAVDPEAAALHLARCGLARAARHVLAHGRRERGHRFYGAALAALPGGPLDGAVVEVAGRLSRRFEYGRLAPLSSHLLNTSLLRGAHSLALAAGYAVEHALLARMGGAGGGYWAPFFSASSSAARRSASSARSV
jgi:hypothetical protein